MKLFIKEANSFDDNIILLTIKADLDYDFDTDANISMSDVLDVVDSDVDDFIDNSCGELLKTVNDAIVKSNLDEFKNIKFELDDCEVEDKYNSKYNQVLNIYASAEVSNVIDLSGKLTEIIQNAVDFANFNFSTTAEIDSDFIGYDQGPNYPAAGGPPIYDTEDVYFTADITVNDDIELEYDDDKYNNVIRKTTTINNRSYNVDTCANGDINIFPKFACRAAGVVIKNGKITVMTEADSKSMSYNIIDKANYMEQVDDIIVADYMK